MDYTNDACMNLFTNEQKKRMRVVMRNAPRRKTLFTTPTQCGLTSAKPRIDAADWDLFPNPATNALFIRSRSEAAVSRVEIFDLHGKRCVLAETGNQMATEVTLQTLSQGVYSVAITGIDGKISFRKFVKN